MNCLKYSNICLLAALILAITIFSSCENVGKIDENEISPSLNDAISILFNNKTEQIWYDTAINYKEYFNENFDVKTASFCIPEKRNDSTSGLILKINGYYSTFVSQTNSKQIKTGKEIVILKHFKGSSGLQIEGKFTRQFSVIDDENEKSRIYDGSIQLISQKTEIIYLHNLKQWTDGGITGIVEVKGKGQLLFERTGNTIFFEKRTIFD